MPNAKHPVPAILVGLAASAVILSAAQIERIDLPALTRIKQEAFTNSQAMSLLADLTDHFGPVLTGSPNMRTFADHAVRKMTEWGLDAHVERYPFGRGWVNQRFHAQVVAPQPFPLIGGVQAWTGGTNGPVAAEVVLVDRSVPQWIERLKGKVAGKFVLLRLPDIDIPQRPTQPRRTDEDLANVFRARAPAQPTPARTIFTPEQMAMQREALKRDAEFWTSQGVLAVIEGSFTGDYGTFFMPGGGSYYHGDAHGVPRVILCREHYGRILRLLQHQVSVVVEMDIRNTFDESNRELIDIIGELKGTDRAGEAVMLGGHFDAIHVGTGATDDVVACVTMIEALRILKAAGLQPHRTVRVGCWSGHEQGLFGSRAYVREHFIDPATMRAKPEHARLSAYYNIDNGAGAIRGIMLQGNDALAPVFTAWMEPLRNLGMSTCTVASHICDNLSFDQAGLPGLMFVQDMLDYGERAHHANMDTYERAPAADVIGNSVIAAWFAWQTANRDHLLPRKQMPTAIAWPDPWRRQ